ncbi:hypothetical protein N658DRAFT_511482 [Parathielavia hyrcaniae]|uniref:Uncharacterized protein n=1 Tax=Parathielavia hyrcaniae TaxID=113614 RepID=A0AAN6PSA5_9PEZI|nr:hypothetical protein N658DRAFT_511482 [Parathielavia hyrcaniae]
MSAAFAVGSGLTGHAQAALNDSNAIQQSVLVLRSLDNLNPHCIPSSRDSTIQIQASPAAPPNLPYERALSPATYLLSSF